MGGGEKHCTFAVHMPTDSSRVMVIEESYASLKKDILGLKQNGRVVPLGDFNAKVGRSTDVIGILILVRRRVMLVVANKLIFS